jgi:Orsellinic acid/F9775 biosynthesis cluster protein D
MQPVIQFLCKQRVLLCTACPKTTCIPLKGIGGHLRKHHKDQFTREQRTKLAKEARKYPALAPRSIPTPHREDGPIPGLHVRDGWECTLCDYVCVSVTNMEKEHARKTHGWVASKPKIWREQTVQVNQPSLSDHFLMTIDLLLYQPVPQVFPSRSGRTATSGSP